MKFTLSWLFDHLETNATLDIITKTLTSIGLEVEHVIDVSATLKDFTVAEIKEAAPHPNADKLRVCQVNDGTGIRQVVCGAPNARAGIKVALAKEGVKIPESGVTIKKTSIRSVESNGMLCSAHELGIGEDGGGIIELPLSALVGDSIVGVLGLNDPVIDIAITPNRADCLSVRGIARDLAAAGLGTLKSLETRHAPRATFPSSISVTLATSACPLFAGCIIRNLTNGPSPEWLQRRLTAIGLRPISRLVDITNYMTFTYGRPLHVFDAAKLQGNLTVRNARDGETLQALNDKQYTLNSSMIAVCDDSGAVGLGGVIGGAATGCTLETTEVFLETALFDAASIAATGRALAIDSDARYRFERGVDPAFVKSGAELAIAMILELCGGEASELVVAGSELKWQRSIAFDADKIESLGGITLPKDQITKIFSGLGFTFEGTNVIPPSWRADIEGSADLVEEVLRIHGYDNIALTALPARAKATLTPEQQRVSLIRKTLATEGLNEICSWAFVAAAQAKSFGGDNAELTLLNPISAELDTMRPNLLPGLLTAAARNSDRGFPDLALFEIGNIFENTTPQGQKTVGAGIRSGNTHQRNHFKTERLVDVFDAKADVFAVLEAAGLNPAKFHIDRAVPGWYHTARAGRISLGGKVTLGFFGEIHPLILDMFHVKQRLVAFEVFLGAIPHPKAKGKARAPLALSNFPSVERDFAFVAEERLPGADIVKALEGADKQLIRSVKIFDIYSGKGVETGKKSIAVSVTLQAMDRTLSEQEIEAAAQKILGAAANLGLVLRQ